MTATEISIGTPVYFQNQHGYVSGFEAAAPNSFSLGTGSMQAIGRDLEIVFDNRVTKVGDTIAATWIERARQYGLQPIDAAEVARRRAAALDIQTTRQAEAEDARRKTEERTAAFREEARANVPSWAAAALVAELVEDKSDSMTDYWGHTTARTIILGFSRHKRDLFPEMRKAALAHPDCADLADAPERAEHREKYSMGAGYYLKNGSRDSNGWRVRKVTLYHGADSLPVGEWATAEQDSAPAAAPAPTVATKGFTIEAHHNDRKGFDYWLCVMAQRVEREEYDELLAQARALGGWYSRPWQGIPGGFAFKNEDKARQFVGAQCVEIYTAAEPSAQAVPAASATLAGDRLREMAEGLTAAIASKFADRRMNTPKQQRQAAEARQEGCDLQRAQAMMRALADHHDAGTVPAELAKVRTKAEFLRLATERIDRSNAGYYDAGRPTGEPQSDEPAARALWAMVAGKADPAAAKAAELAATIAKLRFAKIPGYFPTPAPLVARMLEVARIKGGERVLEPSAGSGAIADALRAAGCEVVCIEVHSTLCGILRDKGHSVIHSDFREVGGLGHDFDVVLMNPPFEKGQDLEHVARAFGHLKPGGRLVAIMGAGVKFRQDRRYADFRAMVERLGGEFEDIPAGAFLDSGTGVASVMLTLDKEA